jgi:ribosomal protein L24
VEREAPIQLSKLMPYDAEAKRGSRISRTTSGETKVRTLKTSGKALD